MTTGMDPHPEVSEISDFSEGLLPLERTRSVQAHLDECDLCRDVLRSLEEIRETLGTLPGPQRMPDDVAGRIDAAIAAEALLDATLPHVPRGTSAGATSAPGRAGDVPRGTSGAPSGHPSGSTGPGRKRRLGDQLSAWRRRSLLAVAGAVGTALLGGVIYAATSGSPSGSNSTSLDSARQKGAAAGASDQVAGQVRDLLAGLSSAGRQHTGATDQGTTPMLKPNSTGSVMQPDGTHVDVPSCVLKATHRTQPPLAAERDSFQGRPSYLVVLSHPNDNSRVDAYVVNASCTATSPGAVLFQGTYPR